MVPGKLGGATGATYLHGDDPQLLGRQPPHLARQHLCLVQDGEVGVDHCAQEPAHRQAEQPEGRPQRSGPDPAGLASAAAGQGGRPRRLLFLRLAGHAASPHSPPTGSRRRKAGREQREVRPGPSRRTPQNFLPLVQTPLRAAAASKLRGRPATARERGRPPSPGSRGRRERKQSPERSPGPGQGPHGAADVSKRGDACTRVRRPRGRGADRQSASWEPPSFRFTESRRREARAAGGTQRRRSSDLAAGLGQPPERGGRGGGLGG